MNNLGVTNMPFTLDTIQKLYDEFNRIMREGIGVTHPEIECMMLPKDLETFKNMIKENDDD